MKYFENSNISSLIIDLYRFICYQPGKEIVGLNVKIKGLNKSDCPNENYHQKTVINDFLLEHDLQSIETVSNTFFPINLWNPDSSRDQLFNRYNKVKRKIRTCPKNRYGIYFDGMINYDDRLNQLEQIIKFYKSGNHRRSAMQVSIWDPTRDLKNARMRGFPCLQQIVFSVVNNNLIVFSFFATQYLFERAYGNFLGLCNLAKFMSHEFDLPLKEVNCYIGVEILDITKGKMKELLENIERI